MFEREGRGTEWCVCVRERGVMCACVHVFKAADSLPQSFVTDQDKKGLRIAVFRFPADLVSIYKLEST